MAEKVVVALSGGVDSSVAALLLKEKGYDVTGVTLLLHEECGMAGARSCCSYEDIVMAKEVARVLGVDHFVLDRRELFGLTVKKDFIRGITEGRTPNPCVLCNRDLKFGFLSSWASELGAGLIATGHYARLEKEGGATALFRGRDRSKDQSYFLFAVPGEILEKTLFPIGGMEKREVRKAAVEAGLPTSSKPDSQDLCFGRGEQLAGLLSGHGGPEKDGPVILEGKEVGRHRGLSRFTIGQRKGISVPHSEPLYVIKKDLASNSLIVGTKEKAAKRRFKVLGWSWKGAEKPDIIDVQVRYRQRPLKAGVTTSGDGVFLEWLGEKEVAAPGQAAVGYSGEKVLGGGFIAEDEDV